MKHTKKKLPIVKAEFLENYLDGSTIVSRISCDITPQLGQVVEIHVGPNIYRRCRIVYIDDHTYKSGETITMLSLDVESKDQYQLRDQ
jgi:hypothetical protein